jgi:hypothetical protein
MYVNGAAASIFQLYLPRDSPANPIRESGLIRENEQDRHEYYHPFLFVPRSESEDAPLLEGTPRKHFSEDAWSSLRLEIYRTELVAPLLDDPEAGWLEEDDLGEFHLGQEVLAGQGDGHTHLIGSVSISGSTWAHFIAAWDQRRTS